jgi:hypothetical protein
MSQAPRSRIIAFATWLLALLGAGLRYVGFDAQYRFILAQKGDRAASLIEAAMLGAGMITLSALGIGLARAGKPSGSVRFLIVICAGASAGINFAAADFASWRSVAAYVMAPVFLAVITDRVIAVIRQHVLPADTGSAWAPLGHSSIEALRLTGVMTLYLLRIALAPSITLRGLRQIVLDATPVFTVATARRACGKPLAHQTEDHDPGPPVPGFRTKKAAFLSRHRSHPEHGNDRPPSWPRSPAYRPVPGVPTSLKSCASSTASPLARARPRRTMTSPQAEPSTRALGESLAALAAQVAALRGQVTLITDRVDHAGLRGELDLAARFEELAQTVAGALDAASPRGPAAPRWIGLDRQAFAWQLAELRGWVDTVLRQHYPGYELRDCWPAISTPSGNCPPWPPNGTTSTTVNGLT